jgi:hypothetical protein
LAFKVGSKSPSRTPWYPEASQLYPDLPKLFCSTHMHCFESGSRGWIKKDPYGPSGSCPNSVRHSKTIFVPCTRTVLKSWTTNILGLAKTGFGKGGKLYQKSLETSC